KLEKEIPGALTASTGTIATQASTPATPAPQTQDQATEKPAARLIDNVKASLEQSSTNTPNIIPRTAAKSTTATSEPISRQLQQLPPPQTQAALSNASSSGPSPASEANQITVLPVSAKRWALVIGVDKYTDPQI